MTWRNEKLSRSLFFLLQLNWNMTHETTVQGQSRHKTTRKMLKNHRQITKWCNALWLGSWFGSKCLWVGEWWTRKYNLSFVIFISFVIIMLTDICVIESHSIHSLSSDAIEFRRRMINNDLYRYMASSFFHWTTIPDYWSDQIHSVSQRCKNLHQ